MTAVHVAHINALHMSPSDFAAANARDLMVKEMAEHLVAGTKRKLDLSSDGDVIKYLMFETPEQYPSGYVTAHMYAAIGLARQMIATAGMVTR